MSAARIEVDLSGLIAGMAAFQASLDRVRRRVEELGRIIRLVPDALARGEVLCRAPHGELAGACPSCRAAL